MQRNVHTPVVTELVVPPPRRRRPRRWLRLILLLIVLLAADYYLYPRRASMGGRSFNLGHNGDWLHYSWYFGQHSDAEVAQLATRLRHEQTRYAYCWTRYIQRDGTLHFRYAAQARHFTDTLRRDAPTIKAIAWVYAGNSRGAGAVDLSNPAVRRAMVREAVWLTTDCGFEGIQWDYEICPDGDADLVRLLRETRAALPVGKLLCVATPMWLPRPLHAWGWSDWYFAKVAKNCDQMAVMCYDSGLYLPRSYVWLVRQQAIHVTTATALGNPRCRVVFGLPTYEAGGLSHHAYAENLTLALKGVREGLASAGAQPQRCEGIALFADYTTDAREWDTYRKWWLTD